MKVKTLHIIIVIYNTEIIDCNSLMSIIEHHLLSNNIKVTIVNNGPKKVYFPVQVPSEISDSIELIQHLENKPLSHIYNSAIFSSDCDYYLILDGDSKLSKSYVSDLAGILSGKNKSYIFVPVIESNGKICSPVCNDIYNIKSNELVTAIGSGLIISSTMKFDYMKHFGEIFDSRFALYGVDTSVFRRLRMLSKSNEIKLISGFEHDFSSMSEEHSSTFRKAERAIDLGLSLKHYFCFSLFKYFIVLSFKYFDMKSIVLVIKYFLVGRHPKCKE